MYRTQIWPFSWELRAVVQTKKFFLFQNNSNRRGGSLWFYRSSLFCETWPTKGYLSHQCLLSHLKYSQMWWNIGIHKMFGERAACSFSDIDVSQYNLDINTTEFVLYTAHQQYDMIERWKIIPLFLSFYCICLQEKIQAISQNAQFLICWFQAAPGMEILVTKKQILW